MNGNKYKKLKRNPNIILGSFCELNDLKEYSELEYGLDFRKPEFRKEVFLRFYEFHLKYRSHPGGVYYLMPYFANKFNWNKEQKYWFAFINGSTQNPCSSMVIFNKFPNFEDIDLNDFEKWHRENWKKLQYDIDRRYVKGHFSEQLQNYKKLLDGRSQEEYFEKYLKSESGDKFDNFWVVWNEVFNKFYLYGRLSTFSYLEYLKIMGLDIDCPDLLMYDIDGSKSHRNGMCKVLGRDDLDWFKDNNNFPGHSLEVVQWLEEKAEDLLFEAKVRFKNRDFYHDVNYFTLESTLCCYKSWHRENRRYPNVYNDMMFERIKKAENAGWNKEEIDFEIFWNARKDCLPEYLRLEDNKLDPTYIKGNLHPEKQNHYRLTGQPIMMNKEWSCFKNSFNEKYYES